MPKARKIVTSRPLPTEQISAYFSSKKPQAGQTAVAASSKASRARSSTGQQSNAKNLHDKESTQEDGPIPRPAPKPVLSPLDEEDPRWEPLFNRVCGHLRGANRKSMAEEILIWFDRNLNYGPGIGLERMIRWRRAHRFGLDPPHEVREILELAHEQSDPRICMHNGGTLV